MVTRRKTETIKERAVYVYLPSLEMVREWKDLANKQRTSVSKFVIEHVQNSLKQEEEPSFLTRSELTKRVRELEEDLSKLKKDNRMLRLALDKLDTELKRYRAEPFLDEEYEGIRKYERELIDLLRRRGFVGKDEILGELGIDPKESQIVKALSEQLEYLEGYGLVAATPRGWRWKG